MKRSFIRTDELAPTSWRLVRVAAVRSLAHTRHCPVEVNVNARAKLSQPYFKSDRHFFFERHTHDVCGDKRNEVGNKLKFTEFIASDLENCVWRNFCKIFSFSFLFHFGFFLSFSISYRRVQIHVRTIHTHILYEAPESWCAQFFVNFSSFNSFEYSLTSSVWNQIH